MLLDINLEKIQMILVACKCRGYIKQFSDGGLNDDLNIGCGVEIHKLEIANLSHRHQKTEYGRMPKNRI